MGYKKELFIGDDHKSFICRTCKDVAIDPVNKPCCGQLVCDDCDSPNCCQDARIEPLPAPMARIYKNLEVKCDSCDTIVTLSNFERHKYHELAEANKLLKQENEELKRALESQSIFTRGHDGQTIPENGEVEKWVKVRRKSQPLPPQPVRLVPKNPPVFILNPVSKDVPFEIVDLLKRAIIDGSRNGVTKPLAMFFEPIRLAMNQELGGDWQHYPEHNFKPEKAKCVKQREIHYRIKWNIPELDANSTGDRVTFDHNSATD